MAQVTINYCTRTIGIVLLMCAQVNKLTKEIEKLNHDHTKLQTTLQKDIKEEQTKVSI